MAIDRMLLLCCGFGMFAFLASEEKEKPFHLRKLLVTFMDEASAQFTLSQWLQYRMHLRYIPIRDMFHREWNDIKLAVNGCGMWWCIVTSTILYNVSYGPWEGCAFWHNLVGGALLAVQRLSFNDP